MIPVDQEFRWGAGSPGQPCGDCFRACLASVLEAPLSRIPHFMDMTMGMSGKHGGRHARRLARQWLRDELDIDLASIDPTSSPVQDFPFVVSVREAKHFVVMSPDGSVYHDPNPNRRSAPRLVPAEGDDWLAIVTPYDPPPDEWQRILDNDLLTWRDRLPEFYEMLVFGDAEAA